MNHNIITFNDVQYVYPDGKHAVNGVTFHIKRGESVGIVGANGAGKSSLLLMLMGILSPTRGTITVDNNIVDKKNLPLIRKKIGFSFQNPDDQLFMTTVYDDVAFGPRNYGLDENEVERRVDKALATVNAVHLKDRQPYKLSGGEKRSAAVASILSMDPEIIVMDEPTAALDPRARRTLINLLKDFKHTKIIATHDLDMVLELCDRTIILNEGKIICDGASLAILSDEDLLYENALEKPLSLQNCPICGHSKT
jgi:cobalt/nickel transport system ATP-binding protein